VDRVKHGVRSPKFIWAPCAQAVLIGWDPATSPPPAYGLIYEGAIGQSRLTTSLCVPLDRWQNHKVSGYRSRNVWHTLELKE
jgi:hypothetical protein